MTSGLNARYGQITAMLQRVGRIQAEMSLKSGWKSGPGQFSFRLEAIAVSHNVW